MIDSNNQFNKLSKSLLDAVRGVMEAKDGTHPKSEKEKDLAAKAPPHDKITHADVLVGRGVLKKHPTSGKLVTKEETEEVENIDEALDAAARYGDHHTAIKSLLKSISQHVENHKSDALKHRDYRGKKGVHWGHVGDLAHVHSQLADIHDRLAQQGEYKATMGESVELDEAPVDGVAAGSMNNDGHLCATKVFHKEWAEGTPIFSQHAEPDADGNIAWYDVMFEHGIEKQVSIEDLDILMSETHERHGKRKMKEDVEAIQELSNKTLSSYTDKAAGERDKFHADRNKTADAARKYFNRKAGVRKALEKTNEEVEDLEELSTEKLLAYRKKAKAGDIPVRRGVGIDTADEKIKKKTGSYNPSLLQRAKSKLANEEVEELDELSNRMLKSYANKANKQANKMKNRYGPALRAPGNEGEYKKFANRQDGEDLARTKLAMRREEVEDLEELSTDTLKSYRKKARAQGNAIVDKMKMGGGDWSKDQKDTKTLRKRAAGAQASGKQLVKRGESLKTEDVELDEARGRPRKNPLPTGQQEEPEPRQHIIQQLQRAKLSMRGGEHVTFKDGTKHMVPGHHAEKILAKYSAMKPAGKEEFQKKIGSSHAAFKEEL